MTTPPPLSLPAAVKPALAYVLDLVIVGGALGFAWVGKIDPTKAFLIALTIYSGKLTPWRPKGPGGDGPSDVPPSGLMTLAAGLGALWRRL